MDSDNNRQRTCEKIFLRLMLTMVIICGSVSNEVSISNNIVMGKIKEASLKEICLEKISSIREKSQEAVETANMDNDLVHTDKEKIEKEILLALNTNINLIQVKIGETCFGYVAKESEGKKILNKVGQLYIEKNKINEKNLKEFEVSGKVDLIQAFGNPSKIDSVTNIAANILSENSDYDLVNIKMKVLDEKEEVVDCDTKIIRSDEIYLGEERTQEGEDGKKKVLNEITYENGEIVKESKVKEEIVVEPKDKIVLSGVKDPIEDRIAFLNKPTRGWVVTSSFGLRWGKNHNGMDIAGEIGDPVLATFDGVVRQRFYDTGYGNVIFLQHGNGMETIYGHLNGFNVVSGQSVKKGDLIGFVGNTGQSTGPHLHFELRVNGKAVDPKNYIHEK